MIVKRAAAAFLVFLLPLATAWSGDSSAGLLLGYAVLTWEAFPLGERLPLSFNFTYHCIFNTDMLDGDMFTSTVAMGF
jgi:hypothetical protein